MQTTTETTATQSTSPVSLSGRALESHLDAIGYAGRCIVRHALILWIRSERLENYGYDWPDFRRLQNQRARVKAYARRRGVDLARACGESRLALLVWPDGRIAWEYTTGQSNNEEVTNLIARLSGYPQRGWLS